MAFILHLSRPLQSTHYTLQPKYYAVTVLMYKTILDATTNIHINKCGSQMALHMGNQTVSFYAMNILKGPLIYDDQISQIAFSLHTILKVLVIFSASKYIICIFY